MAQLLIRNIDDETKERLRKRASMSGQSMEAEARLILKLALAKPVISQEKGLGTQIAEMFEGVGMDFELPEDEPDIPFEFPDE